MSLLAKLRFKPANPVYLLGDAAGVATVAAEEGYTFQKKPPKNEGAAVQQGLLFARDAASVQKDFSSLVPHLAEAAILWIAYPKKSGAIKSDLNRDKGWKIVGEAGYVGVSQASLNDDWSALWFKKPEELKRHLRATPMQDRKTEGVDYVARTVTLPEDAADALDTVPGLRDFFYSFSFSHKREWAEFIAEAKKPDTRARRIVRMLEDLTMQQRIKAAKAAAKQKT